jgi:hypothetical protein
MPDLSVLLFDAVWIGLGLGLGMVGWRHSYRSAINEAQRRHYRRMLAIGAPMAGALLLVTWAVSHDLLAPVWFWGGLIAWTAVVLPGLAWSARRVRELGEPDPYVALVDGNLRASPFIGAQLG